jgi:SRSO17 transposase
MTLKQIAGLGQKLIVFLKMFSDCFGRREPRELLRVYVKGQLSSLLRKNIEAIALKFGKAPRTLQRFLESIKWNEEKLQDRCQQIIARDHADSEAIGTVDESGVAKSGRQTVGVGRQWCGHEGKIDNCVVGVHLGYTTPGFQCLMSSAVYLPEDWANDPVRRKGTQVPGEILFRTKPEIALQLIDRALANGVRVKAWTFDEFYGRNAKFLDGLTQREQAFVGEIPVNFRGWVQRPEVLTSGRQNRRGPRKQYPRLSRRRPACEVRNLLRYSPAFQKQTWQRYRIKDTNKGPEVWEIKWSEFWRKDETGLPSRPQTLIVARNVLTGELKYFLSNRVPGKNGMTLRWMLCVAFGRWSVECCFREAKEELGMDHYQVRGWRSVHRHFYLTQLSHLFCARIRQEYDQPTSEFPQAPVWDPKAATNCKSATTKPKPTCQNAPGANPVFSSNGRLTFEQVRSAMNIWLEAEGMTPTARRQHYEKELAKQSYYQRRNGQARESHTKTRLEQLDQLGIDANKIKSCIPKPKHDNSNKHAQTCKI